MNWRSSGTSICLAKVLVSAACVMPRFFSRDVRHGDEPGRAAAGLEGIFGGPAAPSAATNQGDLDCLILGRMDLREDDAGDADVAVAFRNVRREPDVDGVMTASRCEFWRWVWGRERRGHHIGIRMEC